jgi:hypothetical protein
MKTTILPTTTTKNRTETKFKSVLGIAGQPPWRHGFVLIALILACFAVSPSVLAVVPAPDGGYPGANTVEGDDALFSLTTGVENTAIGFQALYNISDALHNTAVGFQALANNEQTDNSGVGWHALFSNTWGYGNTAFGVDVMGLNNTGNFNTAAGFTALLHNDADYNTAYGAQALYSNTTGVDNTATGSGALFSNIDGSDNTANGFQALYSNTSGEANNAFGAQALLSNISGGGNLAVGSVALRDLTSGGSNVAVGNAALVQGVTVNFNTALGRRALFRSQGDQNVGLGFFAGSNLNDGGTNNIYLGNVGPVPIGSESNTIRIGTQTATTATIGNPPVETHPMPAHTATYIAGISGVTVSRGAATVFIDSSGRLGTRGSSARFKDEIKPMDKASEAILALKPVTFRYKKEIDAECTPQFGLLAEDVEKVNPDLVVNDAEGKVYTVRYEAVNAMLLNEFLKEHKKVEEQQATIAELKSTVAEQRKDFEAISAQQHKEIQALTASLNEQASQIQKVSAQIEIGKFTIGRIHRVGHGPQMVLNNQ